MQNIIAVVCETLHGFSATGIRRRNEQIDNMFIALVDERRYFPTMYVIQPTSDQTEALGREILNRWRESELSVEPRFDRMLIGRGDIEKVSGKQGANMIGDYFLYECALARAIEHPPLIQEQQSDHDGDSRSQG
jgi:hypothetical protein